MTNTIEKTDKLGDFEALTPDVIIASVEEALGVRLTGFTSSLPSYINRVYELEGGDRSRYVAKFYRPGRWSKEALEEEHRFVRDCQRADIPVISPLPLTDGGTLAETEGIHFAVFPKKWGRQLEIKSDEDYLRCGRLIARIHLAGDSRPAAHRMRLSPDHSLKTNLTSLIEHGHVSQRAKGDFKRLAEDMLTLTDKLDFESEVIKIHGDCHSGNILERPDEGMMVIDFDDMMIGPPAQDLWLLLPAHARDCPIEIELMVEGYQQMRDFDRRQLSLIEPLRLMRMVYFLDWCAQQIDDYKFRQEHPEWGDDAFWRREIRELENQLGVARSHLDSQPRYDHLRGYS